MLQSILTGIVIVGVTVVIHAVGTTYWLRFTTRSLGSEAELHTRTALATLVSTAVVLLLLHVVEVVLWAIGYVVLPQVTNLKSFEQAVYFSFVTFTTLGYGDITLSGDRRLLSGIESMNGILLFGWSTAILFSVVQRLGTAVKKRSDSA